MTNPNYHELLLGAGRSRVKRYSALPLHPRTWQNPNGPVTVDINALTNPDIWCDLNSTPWRGIYRNQNELRPFDDDTWDEVHAYQVLEHLGSQGDAAAFFAHFSEIWRILKPNGVFVGEVPSRRSGWLWGDPSHTRAIVPESLSFLDQTEYQRQIDCLPQHRTAMSDFRSMYKADFHMLDEKDNGTDFVFILRAIKPSRWVAPK